MEKTRSHNLRTSFVLNANKLITKKSFPSSGDFQESLIIPTIRVSILSKLHKAATIADESSINTSGYPTKLPVIYSKKSMIAKNNGRYFNYPKLAPKVHSYKPLFHERNKSQNYANLEDNDYFLFRNKLQLMEY